MMLALALCLGAARAVREPEDYRADLMTGAATRISRLSEAGQYDEAKALAERFQRQVEPSAPVTYEIALALNRTGRRSDAIAGYTKALALDPDHAASLYDRGELYLLDARFDLAQADFERAAALVPGHWAVHFRLAELAARAHDSAAFESHLTDAVRNGFDFRRLVVAGAPGAAPTVDPNWQRWARDPELGKVVTKLIVLYSQEDLLELLTGPR
jgi:tetratricopeptide (TPR) repeat protein